MTTPDLSIVVISHDHAAMLPGCIASLALIFNEVEAELVVVDNLPGGTAATALAGIPCTIIENPRPLGFAANANMAASRARGRHILLLNPDTLYESGSIRDLLAFLHARADVGVLGCTLLNADGTPQQSYRQFPTLAVLLARGLAADRWPWRPAFYRQRLMELTGSQEPFPVGWVFGAFMLLRRRDFDLVGGMDESFRLYYEDVDLCRRLCNAGLRTYMFPALRFKHLHRRESAKRPFSRQWRWHVASAFRYFRKAWFDPARDAPSGNPWEMTVYESGRQTRS